MNTNPPENQPAAPAQTHDSNAAGLPLESPTGSAPGRTGLPKGKLVGQRGRSDQPLLSTVVAVVNALKAMGSAPTLATIAEVVGCSQSSVSRVMAQGYIERRGERLYATDKPLPEVAVRTAADTQARAPVPAPARPVDRFFEDPHELLALLCEAGDIDPSLPLLVRVGILYERLGRRG